MKVDLIDASTAKIKCISNSIIMQKIPFPSAGHILYPNNISYSWKYWQRIKFDGLAVLEAKCQIKIHQYIACMLQVH